MFLSEWHEFPSAPCPAGKKNLMTARVSMMLKSRASLTCFRACFLPGRAKDLSAPRVVYVYDNRIIQNKEETLCFVSHDIYFVFLNPEIRFIEGMLAVERTTPLTQSDQ